MTDWSNHTTVEINRLLSLSEKELLARLVYLLDRLVTNSDNDRRDKIIKDNTLSTITVDRLIKK